MYTLGIVYVKVYMNVFYTLGRGESKEESSWEEETDNQRTHLYWGELSQQCSWEPHQCKFNITLYFSRVFLYTIFSFLLIYEGLGYGVGDFSWWGLGPMIRGIMGFLGLGLFI